MDESKEDLVSQAAEKEQSIAKLSDSIVAARRWRERALQFATILSAILTVSFFVGIFYTVYNFSVTYSYHLSSIALPQGASLPLTPFLLVLSPALLFSTLFIICFITTMRFITAYSKKDDELTDKSVTPVPGILERLVSVVERSVRGE